MISALKSFYNRHSGTLKIILILVFGTLIGYRFYTLSIQAEQEIKEVNVSIRRQIVSQKANLRRYKNSYHVMPLINRHYTKELVNQINKADDSIKVMMYIVKPSQYGNKDNFGVNWILQQLRNAMKQGVNVKFLIGKDDAENPFAAEQPNKILNRLQHDNFEGYVYPFDQSLHAKVVLIDEHHAVTGAHNWTHHSLKESHETSLLLKGKKRLKKLHGRFDNFFNRTREFYEKREKSSS